jgi:hypothetical protein
MQTALHCTALHWFRVLRTSVTFSINSRSTKPPFRRFRPYRKLSLIVIPLKVKSVTPWRRDLMPTSVKLVWNSGPYVNRNFITVFTTVSGPYHPTSLQPILILSYHLRIGLPTGLLLSSLLTKCCVPFTFLPCVLHDFLVAYSWYLVMRTNY